jgi:hypothetical protein
MSLLGEYEHFSSKNRGPSNMPYNGKLGFSQKWL